MNKYLHSPKEKKIAKERPTCMNSLKVIDSKVSQILIYDMSGKLIQSSHDFHIELNLNPGVYIISAISKDKRSLQTKKIVLNN